MRPIERSIPKQKTKPSGAGQTARRAFSFLVHEGSLHNKALAKKGRTGKKWGNSSILSKKVVHPAGLEPTTYCSGLTSNGNAK